MVTIMLTLLLTFTILHSAAATRFYGFYNYNISLDLATQSGWVNSGLWSNPEQAMMAIRTNPMFSRSFIVLENMGFIQNKKRLNPQWQQMLQQNTGLFNQLVHNNTIAGFQIGDELMCGGLKQDDFMKLLKAVRAAVPSAFLWTNECVCTFRCAPNEDCHCGSHPPIKFDKFPQELDAVSVDKYVWDDTEDTVEKFVKPIYEQYMYPRLHPHQKLFVIPQCSSWCDGYPKCNFDCAQKVSSSVAKEYLKWMNSETKIGGMIGWGWDFVVPQGKGCYYLPQAAATYKSISSEVING